MITLEELEKVCKYTKRATIEQFVDPLNKAMMEFEIDNPVREQMFLAQVCHESGGFHYVRELASGAEYDIGKKAVSLGNTPEDDDDGELYKGRGLIQITGRANYAACGDALGLDLLTEPSLLEQPDNACRSAGWFWWSHHLNELADSNNFLLITKRINGGLTGYQDRLNYLAVLQQVMA